MPSLGIGQTLAVVQASGDSTVYLLRDDFTTAVAAGSVDTTLPDPGPGGTRSVASDSGNNLSISGGNLDVAGGASTWGNPGLSWGTSYARTAGRLMVFQVQFTSTGLHMWIGFKKTDTPGDYAGEEIFFREDSNNIKLVENSVIIGTVSDGTSYYVALAMRSTGYFMFIKGGAWTNWQLLWSGMRNSTATLYPVAVGYSQQFTTDFIRIPDTLWLPTPVLSDGFGGAVADADGLGHTEGVDTGLGEGGDGTSIWNNTTNWANASGTTTNNPALGSDVVTNGDFANWTGDDPDNFTVQNESATLREINEVGSGQGYGGAGTGFCNIYKTIGDGTTTVQMFQNCATSGKWYRATLNINLASSGKIQVKSGVGATPFLRATYTTTGTKTLSGPAESAAFVINSTTSPTNITIDDLVVKELALTDIMKLANTGTPDVWAHVELGAWTVNSQSGLVIRADAANPTDYIVLIQNGGAGDEGYKVQLIQRKNNTWSSLGSVTSTYAAGDRLVVLASGNTIKSFKINSAGTTVSLLTSTTTTLTTGNFHGVISTLSSNTLDNLAIWPIGTGAATYDDVLDTYIS